MCIKKSNSVYSMSPQNMPIKKINPGDEIIFETSDCFSETVKTKDDVVSTLDWSKINPATGPVYINDAKKGDCIVVEIKKIELEKKGSFINAKNVGILPIEKEETFIFDVDNKLAKIDDLKFDLNPMIGVIGTSPENRDIPTGTPFDHGGNMDCKMIKEGSKLFLPVNVDGALLAMGDLHAAMGDGEIGGCGIE
ncbi:MAG: acetamidase/formamidase family protein, partial [Tissierellia bacterium]|nr:acetamidase/formamidase family protein [Tissierellia bacterium]